MRGDIDENQQYLHEIDKNYPAGYPTFQEIKEQRDNLSVIRQETQRLQALTLDDADKETIEREKSWFADGDQTAADIDRCDQDCKELSKVSVKMTAHDADRKNWNVLETLSEANSYPILQRKRNCHDCIMKIIKK